MKRKRCQQMDGINARVGADSIQGGKGARDSEMICGIGKAGSITVTNDDFANVRVRLVDGYPTGAKAQPDNGDGKF